MSVVASRFLGMTGSGGGGLDLVALRLAEDELRASELARAADHVRQLRAALGMFEVYRPAGLGQAADAYIALRLGWSEWQANRLLSEATVMSDLPGALELLLAGTMSIEQSRTASVQLLKLTDEHARLQLWERIAALLTANAEQGVICPPARLTDTIKTWLIETDPADAVDRRRQAEKQAEVLFRKRDDGLVDISLLGATAPNAQAALQLIDANAAPVGPQDERPVGKRRADAMIDLILGRTRLPLGPSLDGEDLEPAGDRCRPGCGCTVGAPVPCGTGVDVLVPLGGALGTTDQAAEVAGQGPIEPDLLAQLLLAGPRLRATWVDQHGVPVATSTRVHQPPRGDAVALRQALLDLAAETPAPRQPLHPHDHPPDHGHPPPPGHDQQLLAAAALGRPPDTARAAPHPPHTPGPYRVPTRMARYLRIRRPRCEWPGCGVRATRRDLDHDIPHPDGPTCPCNLGPLCRRHHQIKQHGWTKHRRPDGTVRFTTSTGQSWLSPSPHQPPENPARPLPPLPERTEWDLLSPLEEEAELYPPAATTTPPATSCAPPTANPSTSTSPASASSPPTPAGPSTCTTPTPGSEPRLPTP
jgi:hypothetical protein